MTRFSLGLDKELHETVWAHLLSDEAEAEQAAFLFAQLEAEGDEACFRAVEADLLGPGDFAIQTGFHIELADEARIRVIKRAHALGASLVELHSHLGPWPAAFSPSDFAGLRETVPHMRWRLKRRPYVALVVAAQSFDALVWTHENGLEASPLENIRVGDRRVVPTGRSLREWGSGGAPL